MGDERRLLSVIEQIYDSAAEPARFANLAAVLAPVFRTESAFIYTCKKPPGAGGDILSVTKNFDAWAQSAYDQYYHRHDEWFARAREKGFPEIVLGQELIDDASLLRTEWYDYCRKLDAFHLLGATVHISGDTIGALGLHRPRFAKPFGEPERRMMRGILPHLRRALQIRHNIKTLDQERSVALEVIEGLATGVVLVAADLRVIFANRVAERVLTGRGGLSVLDGRLRSEDPRQQRSLERLVGEAARTGAGHGIAAGGVFSITRPATLPLVVLVSPFRATVMGYGPALPAAVVIFSDPDNARAATARTLMNAYALTRAEARLLAALMQGETLAAYAEKANISINTAKTQTKHIFEKMGCNRQVDLIRPLVSNPVLKLVQE